MRTASLLVATLSVTLAACVAPHDDPHPVARALPTADDVRIRLPDGASARTLDAVGDLSPWYAVTRRVTRDLNGGTAWVLILVHAIVQHPPTTVEGATYTWGPWEGGALDPARYRLVVTEVANGSYDWRLDGQAKQPGAAFETVIAGNAAPGDAPGAGHGAFVIDFDAAERVNPFDNDHRGQVAIAYDLAARHLDLTIDTVEARGGQEVPVQYAYTYAERPDGGGDMVFAAHGDTDDEGALAEDAVIRSRWLPTGAGRADVRLSGGDLGELQVTASECWDPSFRVVFYADSLGWQATAGDEGACAFATADLP